MKISEDLEPAGELRADPSGEKFQTRIAQAFPFPFNGLSGKEIQILLAAGGGGPRKLIDLNDIIVNFVLQK